MIDLLVRGGTVVGPGRSHATDVAVNDGLIVEVGPHLSSEARETVDARGMLILPGVIDVHTHVRLSDPEHPERFERDMRAAAAGGTTTVLTFNNPGTGISDAGARSLLAGLDEFVARTRGRSPIDFGLNAVVSGRQPRVLEELPELIARGVPTFKAFMVYDFAFPMERLPTLMTTAARQGGMLQLHCEDPAVIDPLVTASLARGETGPRHHASTRPAEAEARATRLAIELAGRAEAPLYIVHLSSEAALDAVAEAKARGEPVYAETCPHYLTLTDALYQEPDDAELIKRVISPPLRTQRDVDALWSGLREGVLDIVGSDHVPDRLDTEKRVPAPPFPDISNGAPGIETLLSVVYSRGVADGRMSVERMTEVLAANPARLFGLGSKGRIAPGLDADMVVWDPAARRTLRQSALSHTSDFTPYEGMDVVGAPVAVFSRGRRVGTREGRFMHRRLAG